MTIRHYLPAHPSYFDNKYPQETINAAFFLLNMQERGLASQTDF